MKQRAIKLKMEDVRESMDWLNQGIENLLTRMETRANEMDSKLTKILKLSNLLCLTKDVDVVEEEVSQNKEEVEIDLPDKEIYALMTMAHEQDITLNKLAENILRKAMEAESKVSVSEMEDSDTFDKVLAAVESGITYTVYEDSEYLKPTAKILPYKEYSNLKSTIDSTKTII